MALRSLFPLLLACSIPGIFPALLDAQPPCEVCCCGNIVEVGFPCGDFEAPPLAPPGGWIDYGVGQTYCGWSIVSGSISIHHGAHNNLGAGNPNGASQHLDLNGSSPGTIERVLTGLIPGFEYTITLWHAAHNGAGTATAQLLVNNGDWLNVTWSNSIPGDVSWQFQCFTFVAEAAFTTVRMIGSSNNPCCGMLIDDMSMWECDLDSDPPVPDVPPEALIQMQCQDPLPPVPVLTFTDNCDPSPGFSVDTFTVFQNCGRDIVRVWTVMDDCGNTATIQQILEVRDMDPPYFLTLPSDTELPCNSNVLGEFYQWLQTYGGGAAADLCDPDPVWSWSFDAEPDGSCGETTVTFYVTDDCGFTSEASATFSVVDATPPLLSVPAADKEVFCLTHPGDSLAAWLMMNGGAIASDPCQPLTWSNDFNGDTLDPAITVIFTASDGCGQSVMTTATFFHITSPDTLFGFALTCDPMQAGIDTVVAGIPDCETITITTTQLMASDTTRIDQMVCDPAMAGQDTLHLQNQAGCDSLVITLRTAAPRDTTRLTSMTCDPTAAGTDTLFLQNQSGCDSLVITEILFSPQVESVEQIVICGPGNPWSDTLVVPASPCDSLLITHYSYHPPDSTFLNATTCDPAQEGVFVTSYQGQYGCDSTVLTTVILLPSSTTLVEGVTCDPSQEVHTTTTLTNQYGCDSVVWTSILYIGVDTTFVSRSTCDSAQTGVFVHTYPLPGTPCDSVVLETVSWSSHAMTWLPVQVSCEMSGPAADTSRLQTAAGCDSLVIRPFVYTQLAGTPVIEDERCAGYGDGQISMTAISGGTPPYDFRVEGGVWQSDSLLGGLAPGSYTVEVRDGQGCTRSFTALLVQPGETLTVDAGPDVEAGEGEFVDLAATAFPAAAQLHWTATDPLGCPSCAMTTLGPLTASQWVTVQGWTASGCTVSDDLQVILRAEDLPRVYIPNSFSPDEDGINDVFSVYGNAQVVDVRNLAIYDRWGNNLYEERHLPVNDPGVGWDGTFRGQIMDPGVYVYVAEVELADGSTRLYKGDVTLVR